MTPFSIFGIALHIAMLNFQLQQKYFQREALVMLLEMHHEKLGRPLEAVLAGWAQVRTTTASLVSESDHAVRNVAILQVEGTELELQAQVLLVPPAKPADALCKRDQWMVLLQFHAA